MTEPLPPAARKHSRQPLSLAPMIDKTDRDWRWIMRLITRHTLLYTEMITAPAVVRGSRERLLAFDPVEKPLVLQLGWDEEKLLAEACRVAEEWGYDEVNLNCGCPSDKVQKHDFGACLMASPDRVARLVTAMAEATSLPVTVKNRIGIRSKRSGVSLEDYGDLVRFVDTVSAAGCRKFIVHARIAVLEGLSPKENRDIPPLRREDVYRLKRDFPHLFIEINGGYRDLDAVEDTLHHVDAVMLGRAALDNPWMLADADRRLFSSKQPPPRRRDVLEAVVPYIIRRVGEGASRGRILQPLMHLQAGIPGAGAWKRRLNALISMPVGDFARAFENLVSETIVRIGDGPIHSGRGHSGTGGGI